MSDSNYSTRTVPPRSSLEFKVTKGAILKIQNSAGVIFEVGQKFRFNDSTQVGKISRIVMPIYPATYGIFRIVLVNDLGFMLTHFDIEFAPNYISPVA